MHLKITRNELTTLCYCNILVFFLMKKRECKKAPINYDDDDDDDDDDGHGDDDDDDNRN